MCLQINGPYHTRKKKVWGNVSLHQPDLLRKVSLGTSREGTEACMSLDGHVFTDQWSIPYKKEESLGKCLIASTRLAEEG